MNSTTLVAHIQSLELELAVLKAQLQKAAAAAPPKTAADLYGICAGRSETTEEDLAAVKYRPKWEGSDHEDTPA